MERSAPERTGIDRQQICDATQHFARGFVRECEKQDVARIDPVLEQIRHAISKRPRLTRARAGDDQKRSRRCRHRSELLFVQLHCVIDVDRRRSRRAL